MIEVMITRKNIHLWKILRPKENQVYMYGKNYGERFFCFRLYSFTFRLLQQ